jgi:hypothetical protein
MLIGPAYRYKLNLNDLLKFIILNDAIHKER